MQDNTPHQIFQRGVFSLAVPFLMVCAIVHFALPETLLARLKSECFRICVA
jgi:hypothetical protein